jgi:predicted metal-dependent phosphoesterase TrpH
MIADLHCHSTASDGALAPRALLQRALEHDVELLAITDHDTVAAYAELDAGNVSLRLIHGIELSTQWRGHTIHIVGLDIDIDSAVMRAAVAQQAEAREQRAEKIGARLAKLGFSEPLEGAARLADGNSIGRPHFAQYLVDSGQVKSIAVAFKKFLGAGKPGDVKNFWAPLEIVTGWIAAAGGVPVLAHPGKYRMTNAKLGTLVDEFRDCGGRAIEVLCGQQTADVTAKLARLCNAREMFASCGSDFHAPGQPWNELGACGTLPRDCRPVWDLL